jgi:hypothetical protein
MSSSRRESFESDHDHCEHYNNHCDTESEIINITPIFWKLVDNIVNLPYKELQCTREFKDIHYWVHNDCHFIISFETTTLYNETITELFDNVQNYLTISSIANDSYIKKYNLIKKAIKIMVSHGEIDPI